jgi:hypothetical protein
LTISPFESDNDYESGNALEICAPLASLSHSGMERSTMPWFDVWMKMR